MHRILYLCVVAFVLVAVPDARAQGLSLQANQDMLEWCKEQLAGARAEYAEREEELAELELRFDTLHSAHRDVPDMSPELSERVNEAIARDGSSMFVRIIELRRWFTNFGTYDIDYLTRSCGEFEAEIARLTAEGEPTDPTPPDPPPVPQGPVVPPPGSDKSGAEVDKEIDDIDQGLIPIERDLKLVQTPPEQPPAPPVPPPSDRDEGWVSFHVFMGGAVVTEEPELDPFLQNLLEEDGWHFGAGVDWDVDIGDSREDGAWRTTLGAEVSHTSLEPDRVTNQTFPGSLDVSGHDDTLAVLAVFGFEREISDDLRLRLDAGAGIGWRDVEIEGPTGNTVASGDDTVFVFRVGGGLFVPVGDSTELGAEVHYTGIDAIDMTTAGGTPFELEDIAPVTIRLGLRMRI